jgi:hypothetical protein
MLLLIVAMIAAPIDPAMNQTLASIERKLFQYLDIQATNSSGGEEGMQMLTQSDSSSRQFEGHSDRLNFAYDQLKKMTNTQSSSEMAKLYLEQDQKFDKEFQAQLKQSHRASQANCSIAPDCEKLNRHSCFATNNTCGVCKHGFYGEPGDRNKPCSLFDCSTSPDCESLNRFVINSMQ